MIKNKSEKKVAFKSGFVALIGRPNVGKSTFINNVLKQKISIISPKPQTTRNKVQGIYTTDKEQIIFIDTPGIHKAHHELGSFMNKESLSTLSDSDIVLYIVDGNEPFGAGDEYVIGELRKAKAKVILAVNKIDIVKDKDKLLQNVLKFEKSYEFEEIFYISALNGTNVDKLLESISSRLEEGPMYFPSDQVCDHPESFIISEIIREKVLKLTKEEVPHSVAVTLEEMKHNDENPNLMDIRAVVVVERPSQKKIIIGSKGSMIKQIGTEARKDIVMLIGQKVYLELWVRVENDWRNRPSQLKKFGYFNLDE